MGGVTGVLAIEDPDNPRALVSLLAGMISGYLLYLRFPGFRTVVNLIFAVLFILFVLDQFDKRKGDKR